MPRKKWSSQTDITPALLKLREKRKWQIALRRYVFDQHYSASYAPYFGLDIKSIRNWFEVQFENDMSWDSFGKNWQFDHIIPVTYFDFSDTEELKMCWNFTNLRAGPIYLNKNRGQAVDVLAAKAYFAELYKSTHYDPCFNLYQKIEKIEISELISSEKQFDFITKHKEYLEQIEHYSAFEFELLNRGRSIEEVNKEIALLKKINN